MSWAPLRAVLLAAAVVAGAAAGLAAFDGFGRFEPPPTQIDLVACGVGPGPPAIALPLHRMLDQAAPVAVMLGPVVLAGMAEPVTIRFERARPDADKSPLRDGGIVTLPVRLEGSDQLERIVLLCRYGVPARVVYRYGTGRLELPVLPGQAPGTGAAS